jgi:hypothetical protein
VRNRSERVVSLLLSESPGEWAGSFEINGDEVEIVVEYGFDTVREGDAGWSGRNGVDIWIDSVKLENGTDITKSLSDQDYQRLVDEIHDARF